MKKEVVIAIIGGFALGLIITFGIVTAQQSLRESPSLSNASPSITPALIPAGPAHTLFINSPSPNSVFRESKIMVSGSTSPQSMVSVISSSDRNTSIADDQGNFSLSLNLSAGANILEITSYQPTGQSTTEQVNTVYAPRLPSGDPTPTPTISKK